MNSGGSPRESRVHERLADGWSHFRRLFEGEPRQRAIDRGALMLRERAQLVAEDPPLRCVIRLGLDLTACSGPGSEYNSFQRLAIVALADLLRQGVASHKFRRDLDPERAARAIFTWIVGMDSLSLLESDAEDLAERMEEMVALFIPALSATSTVSRSKARVQ